MGTPEGSFTFGPQDGRLLVKTSRTGLGAKAGHDLTIEVTRWRGSAEVNQASLASSRVTVEAEVGSLEVREGTGGVKPLTSGDRAEIKRTLSEKILHAGQHPVITFTSSRVEGTPESFVIEGDLAILGTTRPVTVRGRTAGGRAQGTATVTQSQWGIRPYSAFFGALKLRDEVEVEFDVALPRGG